MRVLVCFRKPEVMAAQDHQALFQAPLSPMRAAAVLVDMPTVAVALMAVLVDQVVAVLVVVLL